MDETGGRELAALARSSGIDFDLVMEIVRYIDIELVATGLAGLVILQLVLELRRIHRRAKRASGDGPFLQVQARRLPGEAAVAPSRRSEPGSKGA